MDFGDILDAWEKDRKTKQKKQKHIMEELLESYLPDEQGLVKDEAVDEKKALLAKRKKLLAMPPQRELDLHGYTVKEALGKLEAFLRMCLQEKLEKVLIIHGKGHHSAAGPVLQKRVLQYIQASPLTGEYGVAPRSQGGRGALWVLLRTRKQKPGGRKRL